MMTRAVEVADAARREQRDAFQRSYGHFMKCAGCGARTTWCDLCDQTIAPTIRVVGYTPPPRAAGP